MLQAEVDAAADGYQQDQADHRETARPRARVTVPALAEDVIHRRPQRSLVGTTKIRCRAGDG
jgi:hypothetical protein